MKTIEMSAGKADECQLPKELEQLAEVMAEILAREYLIEIGILN